MFDLALIKFNEVVWHDQPYVHPWNEREMPLDFFDRDEQRDQVLSWLVSEDRRPLMLLGDRRIGGKTSLIRLLVERCAQFSGERYHAIELPWSEGMSQRDVIATCFDTLIFDLGRSQPEVQRIGLTLDPPTTLCAFREAIRLLLAPLEGRRLLICQDEIDSMLIGSQAGEREAIADVYRALLADDLPTKLLFSAPLPFRDHPVATDLFHGMGVEWVELPPFSWEPFAIMVGSITQGDDRVTIADCRRLFTLAGGWPYFAKLVLKNACELPDPGSDWLDRAERLIGRDIQVSGSITNLYDVHFSDAEKAAMLLLVRNEGHITREQLSDYGSLVEAGAQALTRRWYLEALADGGFRLRIRLLLSWFSQWARFPDEVRSRLMRTS